jgi:hypothetical protein
MPTNRSPSFDLAIVCLTLVTLAAIVSGEGDFVTLASLIEKFFSVLGAP